MKVEVRCADCKNTWLVDERSLGGELMCPSCLTRIRLARSGKAEPDEPAPAPPTGTRNEPVLIVDDGAGPGPARERALRTAAAEKERAELAAATAAAAIATRNEEIVCPRCKLHFYPRERSSDEADETRRTVLVVEDLEIFRQIAEDALAPTYDVKTAVNSGEARGLLAEGGIDLIVLDLTLDGGDEGRQLLGELSPKPCPIVIFTAQDESEMYGDSWEELTQLGADDLVIKGMNSGESLVRKVGRLLGTPLDEEEPIG